MEKFLTDIFAPGKNEILTIMIDIPHNKVHDNKKWIKRRKMASRWHDELSEICPKLDIKINDIVTYYATGSNNSDLPEYCYIGKKTYPISEIIENSTIIISMPEFSATAPLYEYSLKLKRLRVGSMPGAEDFMEETGLSADYQKISEKCHKLLPIFRNADKAEIVFSSGHRCDFDISSNEPMIDDGILHPEMGGTEQSLANLPAGEVFIVPEEGPQSGTNGDLPFYINEELVILKVKKNRIVNVEGKGDYAEHLRIEFEKDHARRNIAEFAIGVNERAVVTGNVLQDEKAGFHWAYGRSDHLGGTVGVKDFRTPKNVVHEDIVYAKGNTIECKSLIMTYKDGERIRIIENGELIY